MEFTVGEPIAPQQRKKDLKVRDPQPYRNLLKKLLAQEPGVRFPVTVTVGNINLRADNHRGGQYQAATAVDKFARELHAVSKEEEFNVVLSIRRDYVDDSESRALRITGNKTTLYVKVVRERLL